MLLQLSVRSAGREFQIVGAACHMCLSLYDVLIHWLIDTRLCCISVFFNRGSVEPKGSARGI